MDRTDLETKIKTGFFELVVYGGSQVYSDANPANFPYWDLLCQYRPRYWAVVGGADELSDDSVRHSNFPPEVLFFCRENRGVGFPISFSIPSEKIRSPLTKTKLWATYEPTMRYSFSDEAAYYGHYGQALLALTRRRGGWDCLRHYEIMACGCVPFFLGIQKCPQMTCRSLPKDLLESVQRDFFYVFLRNRGTFTPPAPYDDYARWYPDSPVFEPSAEQESRLLELGEHCRQYCRDRCTTEQEALLFVNTVRNACLPS